MLDQVHKTELFERVADFLVSKTCCKYSASSGENGSLPTCCQGSQVLWGMFGSSGMSCCKETNTRLLKVGGDDDKPTLIVSSDLDTTTTTERGIDVLIPCCQTVPDSHCHCASSNVGRMHPSVNDVLTILLLALPPQTWLSIKHKGLKEEVNRLTSTDLPPSLEQEVNK